MRQYKYSMYKSRIKNQESRIQNQESKIKNPKRSTGVDGCQKMIKYVDGGKSGKSGKAMPVNEHSNAVNDGKGIK